MNYDEMKQFLLGLPDSTLDFPFGEEASVFKVPRADSEDGKMFAVLMGNTKPLQISLRCDPQLAVVLRDRYESVLPGQNLNKKHWNTILCTGQLTDDELKDLMRLSHRIASES